MNASFDIWKRDTLLRSDTLFTGNTGIYVMPEERSIDIDSALDWRIVEMLMADRISKR
jgi:CMP-N,N'-diacetyllegionaminic acid synthase